MRLNQASGLSAGAALLLVATGLGGCMSTPTYGTGQAPEMALFREVTGGIGGGEKQPIDYQPRAPLVMPPSAELRPPIETASAASAEWPLDPDKTPKPGKYEDQELTPEKRAQLQAIAAEMPERERTRPRNETLADRTRAPIVDRTQRKEFSAALADAKGVGRTERRYLTEPPTEYRQPAPTAPATFEDIDENKSGNFLTRWFTRG